MSLSRNLLIQLGGGGSDEMVQQQRDRLFIIDHQDRVRGGAGSFSWMSLHAGLRCAGIRFLTY